MPPTQLPRLPVGPRQTPPGLQISRRPRCRKLKSQPPTFVRFYDYALDCKSCQAKLTAAQSDLADEKSKTATLTKSRDDAVRAARGGSIWKRASRAAKWFAIGAAAGAIAAKTVR